MYLSFIPFRQVTLLMHSNVVSMGGLSFLWFALSNTTLTGGDQVDFGWISQEFPTCMPSYRHQQGGRGKGRRICYLVMFFWSVMSESKFPKAQKLKVRMRQFRVGILRACCEKECQGWIPAFHRASSRANVSENPFKGQRRCPFQNAKGSGAVYSVCIASWMCVRVHARVCVCVC